MNSIHDLVDEREGSSQRADGLLVNETDQSSGSAASAGSRFGTPENLIPAGCGLITPSMVTLMELSQQHIDSIVATVPDGAINVQDIYPLSALQEGLLFHCLMNEHSNTYLFSTLFELQSRAHVSAFVQALQKVVDRHDVLRTAVLWEGFPRPVQVVYRKATLQVYELAAGPGGNPLEDLQERIRLHGSKLDVRRAPLVRLFVSGAPDTQWHVVMQMHHLVCDYQTKRAVVAEVIACIEDIERGLPAPKPYRDFVARLLASARTRDAEKFFHSKLHDFKEPTAPFGLCDTYGDGSRIQHAIEVLDRDLAQQIRAQARRVRVNTAILFHAAFGLVVAGTCGRDDVAYGTVLSSRQRGAEGQRMLGMAINTLPLRLRLNGITVKELVQHTHTELADLWKHTTAALMLAQRSSGIEGAVPLFTAILNYVRGTQNKDAEKTGTAGIRMIAQQGGGTNYPVAVQVNDLADEISLMVQTDMRIDPYRMIGYMRTAIRALVDALEHAPNTAALSLSILPESERQQLVERFNATQADYSKDMLFHQFFEKQVERTPDAIAVICGDRELNYAELNRRANQIAHALIARGVRPDDRVAIYAERSVEMVAGMLGILKAGGAYVPMDVTYPLERLRHMLMDSAPAVLLTQQRLTQALPAVGALLLTLDGDEEEIAALPRSNPNPDRLGLHAQHLAYVIYTSGSTGTPKGVAVEHRNLVNLAQWHCRAFDVSEGTRCSSVAAVGFDAAGWEIWPPLSVGATLVLAPSQVAADAEQLVSWWATQSLDVSFLPTPLAEFVFSRGIRTPQLRTLLVGGDRLRHRPSLGSFDLVNNYGPTESTVVATSGRVAADDDVLHIGRPISNTQIYILDGRRQLVPLGVSGEMYIGGEGVARGYLNRAEMTAERFVADPFGGVPQSRLYRTGDLARWCADGTIEYLGRNDYQVKIRGFRIELGEIEAQLAHHPKVKDAVVTARQDVAGEKHLVAYVTPHEPCAPRVEDLRAHLKSLLPEYMVPAAFVMLDRLPLTPNGKIDERALPAPDLGAYVTGHYEPPQGEIEEVLAGIWRELLGVARVGREDNFFALGGHSLLAVNSLFNINQAFGCTLKVPDVYRNPTLRDLAARIGGDATEDEFVDLSREATLAPEIVAIPGIRCMPARNVLVTGATGFVGRFLLAQLLEDTDASVHCIVRAQSREHAMLRLRSALTKWNLWRDEFEPRIVAVPGDMSRPNLGIEAGTYEVLARTVDSIYHCATSMNHLESYAMAKPTNVDAAVELLKLATLHRPKLVNYMSTLGVFSPSGEKSRVVNELTSIDHEKHSTARGYAASKWVGEKIFMVAAERSIPCNIFRLGLIWADTQQGRYDELQQGYRLFKSCLLSGYGIEQYRFLMPPTPVDYAARSIVFLANRHHDGGGIFNISSSRQLLEDVFECCNEIAGTSLEILPYYDWIQEMKRLHHDGRSLPAVPLIEYAFSMDGTSFREQQRHVLSTKVRFDCARTHRELESAGIMTPALDDELLKVFVENMAATDPDLREAIAAGRCHSAGAVSRGELNRLGI